MYSLFLEEAEAVIDEMIKFGLYPNLVTYNTLMDSYAAGQLLEVRCVVPSFLASLLVSFLASFLVSDDDDE